MISKSKQPVPEKLRPDPAPAAQEQILSYVRHQIWSGHWQPGAVLPPRVWFRDRFGSSTRTIQRSFQVLLEEKLVRTEGRNGTMVSDRLPHLSSYAVVLPDPGGNILARTAQQALSRLRRKRQLDFQVFYESKNSILEEEESARLRYGIRNRLFAGVFFIVRVAQFHDPVITGNNLPKVHYGTPAPGCPWIRPLAWDSRRAIRCSLEYLGSLNRRKTAVLIGGHDSNSHLCPLWEAELARAGLNCPLGFLHQANPHNAALGRSLMQLLFGLPPELRPDSLAIGDDNFLEPAMRGMIDVLGEEAASRIPIAAQVNFPLTASYPLPAKFFGLDLEEMIESAVAMIDRLRSGEAQSGVELGVRQS